MRDVKPRGALQVSALLDDVGRESGAVVALFLSYAPCPEPINMISRLSSHAPGQGFNTASAVLPCQGIDSSSHPDTLSFNLCGVPG